jgi:hypothetical protein
VGDAFCFGESGDCIRGMSCFERIPNQADGPPCKDDEIGTIYDQLVSEFGAVTFEAWLALLVSQKLYLIFLRG